MFSGVERIVVVLIFTVMASVLAALLAGRLLLTVTTGAVIRRRGFQHDRVVEVEGALRRPLATHNGRRGRGGAHRASPDCHRSRSAARESQGSPSCASCIYGSHHQSIGLDGAAALIALLALACGFGASYLWFGPERKSVMVPVRAPIPLRVAADGYYVERFTELATQPVLAVAGRVSDFDEQVIAPIETSVGESVDYAATGLAAVPQRPVLPVSRRGGGRRRCARAALRAGGNGSSLGASGMSVVLSTIIWAPLLFALIALFLPERTDEERGRVRTVALGGAGVSFFVTTFFAILGQIGLGQGGGLASAYQENHTWFWNFLFQAHYDLVADGISLPLLVVVTTIFGCAIFHSWKIREQVRLYVILVLLVEVGVNGVLCSADFILFVAFWGLLLRTDVPAHPGSGAGRGRRRAAAWFAGFQAVALGADHRDRRDHRGGGRTPSHRI